MELITINLLLFLFTLLNIVDLIISLSQMKKGLKEKNHIIFYLINKVGVKGVIGFKAIILVIMFISRDYFSVESLVILNIVYVLVILNNILKGQFIE